MSSSLAPVTPDAKRLLPQRGWRVDGAFDHQLRYRRADELQPGDRRRGEGADLLRKRISTHPTILM